MATLPSRRISITINVSSSKVYSFASNPLNLPKWASGLSGSIKKVKGKWVADSPMGKFTITFAPKNQFGILDHLVDFKGKTFQNPMRVIPNKDGCDVMFTLFRHPGTSDKAYRDDAKTIEKDLMALKRLMER